MQNVRREPQRGPWGSERAVQQQDKPLVERVKVEDQKEWKIERGENTEFRREEDLNFA